MGMSTSAIYGYGFEVKCSNEQLNNFFLNHKDTLLTVNEGPDILSYANDPNKTDLYEDFIDYDNETTGETGIYGAIADIMSKETGIDFEYRNSMYQEDSYDCEHAILFPTCYPWQFNEVERELTLDSLEKIVSKYMTELGIDGLPDFVCVKYFG